MANKIKIGINGLGRIGRGLFRILLNHPEIEVVAINDLADAKTLSHLLKYDSIHGVLPLEVSYAENAISVNQQSYDLLDDESPKEIKWPQDVE